MTVLAVQWSLGSRVFGLTWPLVLAALPVGLAVLGFVLLRARPLASTDRRSRLVMFSVRVLVLSCLLVAAAGPYTVTQSTTVSNPRVTLLVDDSRSMDVFDVDTDRLVREIEETGIPVSRVNVGNANTSSIGDGIVSNVERGGTVLLVSDGRVTDGRSLAAAGEFARRVNASVSALELDSPATERAVRLAGPSKTSQGVEATFSVAVDGVGTSQSVPVTVTLDDETLLETTVDTTGSIEFSHTFESVGSHRLVARIDSTDAVEANDIAYQTVQTIEPPTILYVSRGQYPFPDLLDSLYDVRTAEAVPSNLDPYTTVVLQDMRASDVGNLDALRSFVTEGNGLVVAGGENAFENGGYSNSPLGALLPVQAGQSGGTSAAVVVTIDVSGSTAGGMTVQKALALDVLDQLDDDDTVGIVAFDGRGYLVAEPQRLGPNRATLEDRISRLRSGGSTSITSGLDGAGDLLGQGGNIVLLSDGVDGSTTVVPTARRLGESGIRIITVGVGQQVSESLLREIAAVSGGSYLRASEASRLRVLFGDRPRSPTSALTVVDASHFITAGVQPTAAPTEHHAVSVKRGADFLVATGSGSPAIAAWRFGLGRVVTVSAYGSDGTLDGLLGRPDSLLLSRSVNWAIGDPERKSTGLVSLADTRLGESTTAVYVGPQRPTETPVQFARVGPERFEATVVPTSQGFETVLGRPFAVDYPEELASFGEDPTLQGVVESTGGQRFGAGQAAAIASFVRQRATVTTSVRTDLAWPFVLTALVVFLVDVAARRLHVYGPGDSTHN